MSKKKLCGCPRARFEQFDPDDEEEAVDVRVTVLRAVMRRQEKRRVVGVTARPQPIRCLVWLLCLRRGGLVAATTRCPGVASMCVLRERVGGCQGRCHTLS